MSFSSANAVKRYFDVQLGEQLGEHRLKNLSDLAENHVSHYISKNKREKAAYQAMPQLSFANKHL